MGTVGLSDRGRLGMLSAQFRPDVVLAGGRLKEV